MARKSKAQDKDKEAEAKAASENKTEEQTKLDTVPKKLNETGDDEKSESSNEETAVERKELEKETLPKPTATHSTYVSPPETYSSPPVTHHSTIEKPPSASLTSTLNTLIDSTLKFFVGGLHPNTDEAELSAHFSKYGQILATQVMRDLNTGRHRGFGFVTIKVQPNSMSVFKDVHTVSGKRVDVRAMQSDVAASLRKKIFVGGLSKALNEEMLEEYFSKFGEIDKVTIMRQLDGTSRGFGFIVFMTEEGAQGSLRNPTHFVYGNKVDVRAAESRTKSSTTTTATPAPVPAVYPYGMMQPPADMYSATQMYRPQAAYDPNQYASMTQQQMLQQYPQYQLLQQQMVQQQMAMAGTYGTYYGASSQQTTPSQTPTTTAPPPNPYAAAPVPYGAYRGKNDHTYPSGGSHPDVTTSRGYRQQPY